MPYLAWTAGSRYLRHALQGECALGTDPSCCSVLGPADAGVEPIHALMRLIGGRWWIEPKAAHCPVERNGHRLDGTDGAVLEDGDRLRLGVWELVYTQVFPSLDGIRFAERAGQMELPTVAADPVAAQWALGVMQRSAQGILLDEDPTSLGEDLLARAQDFLEAVGGALVSLSAGAALRILHQVGRPEAALGVGLGRAIIDHALRGRVDLVSNEPSLDPRFGELSLPGTLLGPVMVAPMIFEGRAPGAALVLERAVGDAPFTLRDLALLRLVADRVTLAHRHALAHRQSLTQSELEGEILRLRAAQEQIKEQQGRILAAMAAPMNWLRAWSRSLAGRGSEAARFQLEHLATLLELGHQPELDLEGPSQGRLWKLDELQPRLLERWRALVEVLRARLEWPDPPKGHVWLGGGPVVDALAGLVEPLLMQLPEGAQLAAAWSKEPGAWTLELRFPMGTHCPPPDPWSLNVLRTLGLRWRWADLALSIHFPEAAEVIEQPARPLLGLVTEDLGLLGLFQGAAEAGNLDLFPLEEDPPLPPLPSFEVLVVDVRGVEQPTVCVEAYRRHPAFITTPILVVRAKESESQALLNVGATDWLPDNLQWEVLHHRLQVLRSHQELQRKALLAERLVVFKQMAGTLKHEINNPLAVISLQVELLQRRFPEEPKLEKIAEMVGRIQGLLQVLQKMREADTEAYPGGGSIMKV